MSAFVKNIRSMWNVWGYAADGCVKAVKRELGEYGKGWQEVEEYWREHPEARAEFLNMHG